MSTGDSTPMLLCRIGLWAAWTPPDGRGMWVALHNHFRLRAPMVTSSADSFYGRAPLCLSLFGYPVELRAKKDALLRQGKVAGNVAGRVNALRHSRLACRNGKTMFVGDSSLDGSRAAAAINGL